MNFNSDFKYDLMIGQTKEKELSDIFYNKKIEVKYDKKALKTGNVFVEYLSRGKKSGLATTQSDFYCFVIGEVFHLIPTKLLKIKCQKFVGTNRDVKGGDSNTSNGILLPIEELL